MLQYIMDCCCAGGLIYKLGCFIRIILFTFRYQKVCKGELQERLGLRKSHLRLFLVKQQTYMRRCSIAVAHFANYPSVCKQKYRFWLLKGSPFVFNDMKSEKICKFLESYKYFQAIGWVLCLADEVFFVIQELKE